MERLGEQYLSTKRYDSALLAFRINHRDYAGSVKSAIAAVQKALATAPADKGLQDLAGKLMAMQAAN
jgi:hypothetical protein